MRLEAIRVRWMVQRQDAEAARLAETGELPIKTRFGELAARRSPFAGARVTLSIALVLALVFGLEYWWGGPTAALLTRMGALLHADAWQSRWYRLFAATFVHTGLTHFVLNGVVLLVAGRAVERVLGGYRLLVVYFASALFGGAAASWLTPGASVGASGAVFGVVINELALAFRTPERTSSSVERRDALVNVALLSLSTLNPSVDVAAHVAGAVAGGALSLLFRPYRWCSRPAPLTKAFGVVLTVLAGVALPTAIVCGKPWQLTATPSLSSRRLDALGVWAELPDGLGRVVERSADGSSVELAQGQLTRDPAVVALARVPLVPGAANALRRAQRAFAVPPEPGARVTSAPRIRRAQERDLVVASYAMAPGLVLERAVAVLDGAALRVEILYYEEYRGAWDGVAARIAGSARKLR